MNSDISIHPPGSWKAWLEYPVDARPLMTSGLVGVIDWEGPWSPGFREQAPLNFWFALLTGGGGGTRTPMVSSPASWLKDSCSTAASWLHFRPADDSGHLLLVPIYMTKAKHWVSLPHQPTSSVFCHLLLVDGSCILLEVFPLTTPIPSQ